MDVRGFATPTDFGGGWDTYGDPPVMDLLMPEGQDQYETLRAYRSQPSRFDIVRAKIPFLYPNQKAASAIPEVPIRPVAAPLPPPATLPAPPGPAARPVAPPPAPIISVEPAPRPASTQAPARPVQPRPAAPLRLPEPPAVIGAAGEDENDAGDESVAEAGFVPLTPSRSKTTTAKSAATAGQATTGTRPAATGAAARPTAGFLPLPAKKTSTTPKTTTAPTTTVATAGFVPLKPGGSTR
jgi:DnaK suppressor protein